MNKKDMPENTLESNLTEIFSSYPEVIAVYLFGSYLDNSELARDIDLAVLLKHRGRYQVDLYMDLYPRLAQALSPLEPDLLFFHEAPLPLRFEIVSTGKVLYSSDEESRTDNEYIVSGEYLDFRFHLEMIRQELFEAIKEETPLV